MDIFKDLEFDIILRNVAALASAEIVSEQISNAKPVSDIEQAEKLLKQTGAALNVLASHRPNLCFDNIIPIVDKAKVGAILSPSDLLKIKSSISALRSLKSCVENMSDCDALKDITAWVRTCDELEYDIDKTVENETDIKDSASEKLYAIRRSIMRANAKLKERLDSYTRQSEISKYLRDNIVTLRGGRYVLPVRSDSRSFVKGLVHDISSTGATVFIEPFAVVEANNELITLHTEEQNEIERILTALSIAVVNNASMLVQGQDVLVECGVIFAKAEYAKITDSYCPHLNTDGKIILKGARHPLIARDKIVPVDITLDEKRVLLISGPNTGGKTVALKTVGLFALLVSVGMYIPASEGSSVGIFDKIYCDIGDSQSITQSLSTFSAHVVNLSEITSDMDGNSLVLLDEVGDGTDPDEGAALAIAIIKKILSANSTAVVTTHFNSVKEFALSCAAISNACMQFDNVHFRPTYRLLQGVSGSSYALEIAEKLGLGQDIINNAKSALSKEKVAFDAVMRETEKLRNETLLEKQRCEALRKQAEYDARQAAAFKNDYRKKLSDINDNARNMIRRQAEEYATKAEEIIDQIKAQLKSADEAALFNARKSAKKLSDGIPVDKIEPIKATAPSKPEDLSVGTHVYVSGLNKEGIITSGVKGNKAIVAIGSIKTELPISSLSVIKQEKEKKQALNFKTDKDPENREVMLLGYTVDDATIELDRILSDIAPRSTIRIVHGKGTGALGKGIQSYLKRQTRVKSFRYGRYGEGDTGVTIVEIK